jgi:hypothetical protein
MKNLSFIPVNWLAMVLVVLAGVLGTACNRELPPDPIELEYFPVETGKYRVYEVRDTTFTTTDTVAGHYFKREEVSGTEQDALDRTIYRLDNYRAEVTPEGTPGRWRYLQLWSMFRSEDWAERIEGNTRFVVLDFPLNQGKRWNGNIFNNNGAENFTILSRDTTVTFMGRTYTNCLLVRWRLVNDSRISELDTYEAYQRGIGKVFRLDKFLKWNIVDNVIELSSDSYIYREALVDHNF